MRWLQIPLILIAVFLGFYARADKLSTEQYRAVAVRKIGHELLLKLGDSTSRILPIQVEGNRYTLKFDRTFGFRPEFISTTIDSVLKDVRIQTPYMVEVLNCTNAAVEYSFLKQGYTLKDSNDILPCGKREYPDDCYRIAISFEDDKNEVAAVRKTRTSEFNLLWLIAPAVLALFLWFLYRSKRGRIEETENQTHIIEIGAYLFDKRSMHLSYQGETVELTSKEADLLFLLHSSKNETVERDTILRIVWGDDGDYVGRTLDVFISKLRKKLAGDPSIKIANIRGVGYRLVVDTAIS